MRLAKRQSTKLAGVTFASCLQIVITRTKRHRWRGPGLELSIADDNVVGNRGKVTLVTVGGRPFGHRRNLATRSFEISGLESSQIAAQSEL